MDRQLSRYSTFPLSDDLLESIIALQDDAMIAWCPHIFEPPISGCHPLVGITPLHCSSIHKPLSPRRCPSDRSEFSGRWQTYRHDIHIKYFVNILTTISLYQKTFINSNLVNKIKWMYWFNYKTIISSQRKRSKS